jgi:hypothetical protein
MGRGRVGLRRGSSSVSSHHQKRSPTPSKDSSRPNSTEAYVLYRELDYFEQLAALEHLGHFDFELIKLLLGQSLVNRWDIWKPSIDAMGGGSNPYPRFEELAKKMERAIKSPANVG